VSTVKANASNPFFDVILTNYLVYYAFFNRYSCWIFNPVGFNLVMSYCLVVDSILNPNTVFWLNDYFAGSFYPYWCISFCIATGAIPKGIYIYF
jgi:hypothetical protein